MNLRHPLAILIASLALCLSSGYAEMYFCCSATAWFAGLKKPALLPTPTTMYYVIIAFSLFLALGLFLIWRGAQRHPKATLGVWCFAFCLVLNVGWTFVFFSVRSLFFSLPVMALLIAMVIVTMYVTIRSAPRALIVLIPYLLILLIVLYGNFLIWMMNPEAVLFTIPAVVP